MVASQSAVSKLSAFGVARSTVQGAPLNDEEARAIHAFWRACNYLAVGMIYLQANALLREPLKPEHIKNRMLGHWGASPALSFIYTHLNRVIKLNDLDMIYMAGPGHGAPGVLGPVYLEGSYSEIYPEKSLDEEGLTRFFKEFSFPGGIGSHCTPETPGSIHEGGELGYVLSHACGAAFDNPDLIVAAVVGDGEAETGPLATSWHINKFLNPIRDGAVLPILNLNGYKINNPTLLARITHEELEDLFKGYGYTPYFVEGSDAPSMHQAMAATLDRCVAEVRSAQSEARNSGAARRPRWPMIVLRTPKGWTAPGEVNGKKLEGFWRSHQVPLAGVKKNAADLKLLEEWMRGYKPEELFDENGTPVAGLRALTPAGSRRMGANPHANGGLLKKALRLPDFRDYAAKFDKPGQIEAENTRPLGMFLRDVMKQNMNNFRVFGPDENSSNKLDNIYEVSKKFWIAERFPEDDQGGELAADGRVIEMLSEHTLEGMFEGYLLTGRHGLFSTYEAFAHVIDSMFNQQRTSLAPQHCLAQPAHHFHSLATGSQRLYASGPRLHRCGSQQAGRGHAHLPSARCQQFVVGSRSLPAQRELHQRDRQRQTNAPAISGHGRRSNALHQGDKHLGPGQQRPGNRARCGDGLRRRYSDAGSSGGDGDAARRVSGFEDSLHQRNRSIQDAKRS